jgi:hypothetical protein
MLLPAAHDVLVLDTGSPGVAPISVQISKPEMRQGQRVVQVERAAKGLERLVRLAALRCNHPYQEMGTRLQVGQTQNLLGLRERFVIPAAMHVHAPE